MLNLESLFNTSREAVLESLFNTVAFQNEMLPFPKQENHEALALVQKSILGTTNIREGV